MVLIAFSSALAQISVLVTVIVVGRVSGVEAVATLSLLLALSGLISGVFDFGSNNAWIRESAAGALSNSRFGILSGRKIMLSVLLGASLSLVLLVVPNTFSLWLLGLGVVAQVTTQTLYAGLRAASRNVELALITVSERLLFLALFAALFVGSWGDGSSAVLIAQFGSAMVTFGAGSFLLKEMRPRPNLGPIAEIWRGSLHFGLSSWAVTAQSLHVPIVTAAGGSLVAGQYGAVNRWTQPMALLTQTFSLVVVPYVAREGHLVRGLKKIGVAALLPLLSAIVCSIVFLFSDEVVVLLMGPDFNAAGDVLRVLALATGISALSQPMSALLQARGSERVVSIVFVVGVGSGLALAWPFVAQWSAVGGALAILVSQVVMLVGLVPSFRRAWRIDWADK